MTVSELCSLQTVTEEPDCHSREGGNPCCIFNDDLADKKPPDGGFFIALWSSLQTVEAGTYQALPAALSRLEFRIMTGSLTWPCRAVWRRNTMVVRESS